MNDTSSPAGPSDPASSSAAAEITTSPAQGAGYPPALPADLRVPWDGVDLWIFAFFWLGTLYLATTISGDLVSLWSGQPVAELERVPALFTTRAILQQVMWLPVLMLYLAAVLRVRFQRPFWHGIGWRAFRVGRFSIAGSGLLFFLAGLLFSIGVQVGSMLVDTGRKLPVEKLFEDRSGAFGVMLLAILGAPLVEETIFRGYVYPVLARRCGIGGGVVLTGILFGLLHAVQLWGGWGQIALLILVGMVLSRIRASSGSVLPCYFFHLGYNSLIAVGYFSSGG